MIEKQMNQTKVRRTWKSDGSVNLMGLTQAALNLMSNSLIYDGLTADNRVVKIKDALLRGKQLETRLATFERLS